MIDQRVRHLKRAGEDATLSGICRDATVVEDQVMANICAGRGTRELFIPDRRVGDEEAVGDRGISEGHGNGSSMTWLDRAVMNFGPVELEIAVGPDAAANGQILTRVVRLSSIAIRDGEMCQAQAAAAAMP